MNYSLIINVAFHLLTARLKQTVVAAVGVTFGISMFIALNGFMNGLNDLLDGLMLNRTPHILLYNDVKPSENQPATLSPDYEGSAHIIHSVKAKDRGKAIYDSKAIINALLQDSRVTGVAPKIDAAVFYNSGTIDITGVMYGIDTASEEKLFNMSQYITEGCLQDVNQNNRVIIGKGLADKMLLSVGDIIGVTSSRGSKASLKVAGIYQSGIAEIDNVIAYTSLATVQQLLGEPANYFTSIQVKLADLSASPAIAAEFHRRYNLDAMDYQTANAQFETGSTIRSIISYTVGIVLLTVAGFGIYNILNMMIFEKMDSIAILKATGFSGRDVMLVFLSISIAIGTAGGLLGLVFGYFFSSVIDSIPFHTESLPTVKTFPVNYEPVFYGIGLLFALFTTAVAGLFPALKAGSVDPVEIIRGK